MVVHQKHHHVQLLCCTLTLNRLEKHTFLMVDYCSEMVLYAEFLVSNLNPPLCFVLWPKIRLEAGILNHSLRNSATLFMPIFMTVIRRLDVSKNKLVHIPFKMMANEGFAPLFNLFCFEKVHPK